MFNLALNNRNRTSALSFMGDVVKYFGSEWSFARFRVPETASVCAFGSGVERNAVIGAKKEGRRKGKGRKEEWSREYDVV